MNEISAPVASQTWQSTILVVSHDRNFLNAVATDIIHLHSQRLDTYRGDYENFVKTKEDRQKSQLREYEAQKQYRDHIQVGAGLRHGHFLPFRGAHALYKQGFAVHISTAVISQ